MAAGSLLVALASTGARAEEAPPPSEHLLVPLSAQTTITAGKGEFFFSRDGRYLAAADRDGHIQVWDVARGERRGRFDLLAYTAYVFPEGDLLAVTFPTPPDWRRFLIFFTLRAYQRFGLRWGVSGDIHLIDLATGAEKAVLRSEAPVLAMDLSKDGVLASGGMDGSVRLWDVAAGKELARLEGHGGPVVKVTFSPDGRLLACASPRRPVRVWDVGSRTSAVLSPKADPITALAFSPDGDSLAYGERDGRVRAYRGLAGGLRTIREDAVATSSETVMQLGFSADGRSLISVSSSSTVSMWLSLKVPPVVIPPPTFGALRVERLFTDGADPAVLLRAPRGELLKVPFRGGTLELERRVQARNYYRAGGYDWLMKHDPAKGKRELDYCEQLEPSTCKALLQDRYVAPTASPDAIGRAQEHWLAGSALFNRGDYQRAREELTECHRLDPSFTGCMDLVYEIPFALPGRGPLSKGARIFAASKDFSFSFSQTGRYLALSGKPGLVDVWDLTSGKRRAKLGVPGARYAALQVSPDGKYLALAPWGSKEVLIWDTATNRKKAVLSGHTRSVVSLDIASDGTLASGGLDFSVRIWDVAKRWERAGLAGHPGPVTHLAFSRDGRSLASAGPDGPTRLWNLSSMRSVPLAKDAVSLAFSPTGESVAVGASNEKVHLHHIGTNEIRETAVLASSGVPRALAFSADGRYLLAHTGTTLEIWQGEAEERPSIVRLDLPGDLFMDGANPALLSITRKGELLKNVLDPLFLGKYAKPRPAVPPAKPPPARPRPGPSRPVSREANAQANAHWNAGIIFYQKGELEKARAEWTRCVELDPSDSDCVIGLTRLPQAR
ncbi:MAG: hypothetical protein NTX64_03965 [Elusimicrobia bacterium]|nr:hypothetical protein [Elusimicrobiota bacterium]